MSNDASGPIAEAIKEKLTAAFTPVHLEVRNESHMHKV
jgi:stress-induced morphogen